MDIAALFFLASGLYLGWSLGANEAANVFGTAVGTRMVRFLTAAVICGVFVILGAVIGGAGRRRDAVMAHAPPRLWPKLP